MSKFIERLVVSGPPTICSSVLGYTSVVTVVGNILCDTYTAGSRCIYVDVSTLEHSLCLCEMQKHSCTVTTNHTRLVFFDHACIANLILSMNEG